MRVPSTAACSTPHFGAKRVAPATAHSMTVSASAATAWSAASCAQAPSSSNPAALYIRIDVGFGLCARMRQGALARRADVLRVAPQRTGVVVVPARSPRLAPLGQYSLGHFQFDRPGLGVDRDH